MKQYAVFSGIFGLISGLVGILLAAYLELPPGPMVVIVGIAVFAVTVIINWRLKLST